MRKASVAVAGACLLSLLLAPDLARADGCSSLLSSINTLKANIPREPRDAANDDRQVLQDYVGLYNNKCTGSASRPGGGGGAPYRGGGNNPANALGAAANALGALGDLLDDLDRENQEEAAREQQREYEQQQEEAEQEIEEAQQAAAQRAAAAQARAAQAALDAQQRQALANPFGGSGGSSGGNPFDTSKGGKAGNPFATTASAAPPPAPTKITPTSTGGGVSQNGFKTDTQIKTECAGSGNPSMCQMTEMAGRSSSPAYKKYVAAQKKKMNEEIAAKQKKVQELLKNANAEKAKRKPPESIGALPAILAGLPVPNDDGLECGPAGRGRRQGGQCMMPDVSPGDCAAIRGNFYPGDDDHPTPFCATSAPANPMTAHPGPHEGEQCGDVAGHIHGGACWALGITRDDCAELHGITLDNGGFQYCAYDAAQLDAERDAAAKAAAEQARLQKFRDDLRKKIAAGLAGGAGDSDGDDDGDDAVPSKPPVVPVVAKQDPPPPEKQPWKPDYACRLDDGTVIHTDDPFAISGYAIDHPPDCHLTNSPPIVGLTGQSDGK